MAFFYLIVTTLLLISLGLLDVVATSDLLTATPTMAKRANADASNEDATTPVSGLDGMR